IDGATLYTASPARSSSRLVRDVGPRPPGGQGHPERGADDQVQDTHPGGEPHVDEPRGDDDLRDDQGQAPESPVADGSGGPASNGGDRRADHVEEEEVRQQSVRPVDVDERSALRQELSVAEREALTGPGGRAWRGLGADEADVGGEGAKGDHQQAENHGYA